MRGVRPSLLLAAALALGGCTLFPDVGRPSGTPVPSRAPYPTLLPVDSILAQVPPAPDADPAAALNARAAALKARAGALQAIPADEAPAEATVTPAP